MAELYLIRHGQASFGAANYDQLSALGYQQARWLGEHFRDRETRPDRLIIGDMARHRQTAESLCEGFGITPELEVHAGFNEFDFHQVIKAYVEQNPDAAIDDFQDKRKVYGLLRTGMTAWSRDEIDTASLPETWQAFHDRVASALAFARQGSAKRTFVASSGGAIAMALSQVMGFDENTLINTNLQSKNTGVSHFYYNSRAIYLTSFNNVPHLDIPGRLDKITHS